MASRDEQRKQRAQDMSTAEQGLFKAILRAITEWLKEVAHAVLAAFRQFGTSPNPSSLWRTVPSWNKKVVDLSDGPLLDAAEMGWERTTDAPFVSSDSFVQAQLAMTRNFLVRIPDEVYHLIFAEISDGVNLGENVNEIVERVENVLSMTHSQRWQNRARTIAQTESIRAYNAGSFASALQRQFFGQVPLFKEWLATEDARTRPSHRKADGQRQQLNQPFIVGGVPLLYPGDPMGPPEEVISCRCALVVEEAR